MDASSPHDAANSALGMNAFAAVASYDPGAAVDDEPEPADGVSHASARPETDVAEAASHDDDDDDELALDDPSIPDELLAFGFCRSCQGMFVQRICAHNRCLIAPAASVSVRPESLFV
jgi:hypothetical protein